MKKIRITAVSYLNTFPFVYGLQQGPYARQFSLRLAVPSQCAVSLKEGSADIALIPAGALRDFGNPRILTRYCIGAEGPVRTVLLLSEVPLSQISLVALDFDSRTSVELVKVLARHYWKIKPQFIPLEPGVLMTGGTRIRSVVAIGDKTFELAPQYPYVYDLAAEWISFTALPFVFAVWAAAGPVDEETEAMLNESLQYGISHLEECVDFFRDRMPQCGDCVAYLRNNISYLLDERKWDGMNLFHFFTG